MYRWVKLSLIVPVILLSAPSTTRAQDCDQACQDGIAAVVASGQGKVLAEARASNATFLRSLPCPNEAAHATQWLSGSILDALIASDIMQDAFYHQRIWYDFTVDMTNRFKIGPIWSLWPSDGTGIANWWDTRAPLARTYHALGVLAFGVTTQPSCPQGYFAAENAYCWAGERFYETVPNCASYSIPEAVAQNTVRGWNPGRLQLYWTFFYGESVIERAATIVHEARHSDDCTHNVQNSRGAWSKDASFWNGCRERRDAGAFAFEIWWTGDFIRKWYARSDGYAQEWGNETMMRRAKDYANGQMAYLNQQPCWEFDDMGNIVQNTDPHFVASWTGRCENL